MGFLTPLSLLFTVLSIPILILYMLKLRRRDVLVSSTLLWQHLVRDREANLPWQRLRRNLLLFLQLLILALLTSALARPFIPAPAVVSGSVVILLDASASMRARDVAPTRFDAARRAAREIVEGLGAGDAATLIAAGPQPRVLALATNERALLRRALEEAAPTAGSADWEAAFALAAAGLAGSAGSAGPTDGVAHVVIISDGALPETLPPLPGEVQFVGVGGGGDNLGIVALAVRAGPAGPQAFLRVVNNGDTDAGPLVEFSVDGTLFDARRLSVPAHASASLTLTDLPYPDSSPGEGGRGGVLQAHLAVEDALPLDNTSWAVHTPPASGQVLLVSNGNLFLERALGALPGVELVRLPPGSPIPLSQGGVEGSPISPSQGGAEGGYDLYVYDSAITGTLPTGNLWLIAPLSPLPGREGQGEGGVLSTESVGQGGGFPLQVGGFFTATTVTRVASDDPLLRYVDLSAVHVLQARMIEPPPGARVLVEAEGGPLLFVAERPEGRLAVLTFDLHDSDLPLQVAFPILVANLTGWLLPRAYPFAGGDRGGTGLPQVVRPGDPVTIQPAPEATKVVITAPDGTRHTLLIGDQLPAFVSTDQLGVYRIEQLGQSDTVLQSAALPVNLFDEAESNIRPRETVRVGHTEVAATPRQEEGRREFWPWLAGAALGVLVVEWWMYQIANSK